MKTITCIRCGAPIKQDPMYRDLWRCTKCGHEVFFEKSIDETTEAIGDG